jgi:hypothetical protein
VSKRPLFSTYSQGENRVTGSLMAVFTRIDLTTLEQLLAYLSGETTLDLVAFDVVRPQGGGRVPDASISSNFKYLFEVKTAYDTLSGGQLRGHLKHLTGAHADERLFALTPDEVEPAVVAAVGDERLRWFNFQQVNSAIDEVIGGDDTTDGERLLLRELQTLFSQEGLLGREDTVVVAASKAYDFYLAHSAYVCQAGRAFRKGLARLGFYRRLRIERHFPKIIARRDGVLFDADEVARLRTTSADVDRRLARVIEDSLASGERIAGQVYQVFLLSEPEARDTLTMAKPIVHAGSGRGAAWTMGQRYIFSSALERAPETTVELAA